MVPPSLLVKNDSAPLKSNYFIRFIFCLLLLFVTGLTFSQTTIVSGTIKDSTAKEILPFVTVQISPGNTGTVANEKGFFSVQLAAGTYTFTFTQIGYSPLKKEITVKDGIPISVSIQLAPAAIALSNDVLITAKKFGGRVDATTVSMEVLKPDFLEHTNQASMETAVEQVPGVTVIDGQANIRGGSGFSYGAGSRVLVLMDDLPVLAADANDVKWNFLPIENVGEVDVLKGASSALFGSSALNGVINMQTAFPKDKPETHITLYSGFYDHPARMEMKWWGKSTQTISGINFSHRQKFGALDVVLGGHFYDDKGYRKGETEKRIRGNINLRYHFKKIHGLIAGLAVNTQRTDGGNYLIWLNDSSGALLPLGGVDTAGSTLSLYTTYRTTIDPYFSYTTKKSSYKLRGRYFLTNNINNTNQKAKAIYTIGEFIFQHHLSEHLSITAGLSESTSGVSGELYIDPSNTSGKIKSNNFSTFLQVDAEVDRWKISGGARREIATIAGSELDPEYLFRVGSSYRFLEATFLRASYGQGFRFPSIAEKFVTTRVGDIVVYPNDSLTTESGSSAEIGVNQFFKIGHFKGVIDISVFETDYTNMMEFTFGRWGNPLKDPFFGLGFKSKNIGNTKITGTEISVGGEGEIGKFKESFLAGFTYIDPIQKDFNAAHDTLVNSSKENILKYRFKRMWKFDTETTYKKWSVGMSGRYYSFMENIDKIFDDLFTKNYRMHHNKGDVVFDMNLGYQAAKSIRISVIIKNLFNHEYMGRPCDIQPMRTFSMQIGMVF